MPFHGANCMIKTGKKEGICEYAANDSSFPVQEGWTHLVAGDEIEGHSYSYFLYRVAVTYMCDVEKLSFSDVVDDERNLTEVLAGARKYIETEKKYLF